MGRIGRSLVVVVAGAVVGLAISAHGSPPASADVGPCGLLIGPPPAKYTHVIVIMDENFTYKNWLASTEVPYTHGLAASCGSESNMHAATHPSQPNYMAATSGVATTVGARTANANIFNQAEAAGDTWRNYAESEDTACQGTQTQAYKAGHVPAYWYTNLRTPTDRCSLFQVPQTPALDNAIAADNLATFTWITPNLCDAMYYVTGCPTTQAQRRSVGDTWLSSLIPRLTSLPSYQAGTTLIIITFDEGDATKPTGIDCAAPSVYAVAANGCNIPTVVISPYIVPGAIDAGDHNLYGLLTTVEDILGYPYLGRAATESSLRVGLGF